MKGINSMKLHHPLSIKEAVAMELNRTYWTVKLFLSWFLVSKTRTTMVIISNQKKSVFTNFLETRSLWDRSIENALFVTLEKILELAKKPMVPIVKKDSIIFYPSVISIVSRIIHRR